ncbi:MAG: MMPL family transporter, partial [Pseudomonadota bacterium]
GAPIVALALGLGVTQIFIDDTYTNYFDERFEFRRHTDLIERHLTGLEIVEFDVAAGEEGGVYDPAYIDKLARFDAWMNAQPKVAFTASMLEIYDRLHEHFGSGGAQTPMIAVPDGVPPALAHAVPADRAALAQYVLTYEMSLPRGQDLANKMTIDKSASRVSAILRDASTAEIRRFREAGEAWLRTQAPQEMAGPGTGMAVMYAYLSSVNINAMIGGTAVTLVFISIFFVAAFRSVKFGAISLLPNLLPGVLAFGIWGYLVGKIGLAVSITGALTLGIIVDDTVHMIWRFREARRNGQNPDEALRTMFSVVGEPMLISTLVLVAGFTVLSTSGFYVTSALGALSAMIVGIALIADWFLLGPVLGWIERVADARAAETAHPPAPKSAAGVSPVA